MAAAGKTTGSNNYPHSYNFKDGFDSLGPCKKGMSGIFEFPVERGAVYSGGKVTDLSERVVFQMSGNKGVYCGIMTHEVRLSLLRKGRGYKFKPSRANPVAVGCQGQWFPSMQIDEAVEGCGLVVMYFDILVAFGTCQ